jgi:radical SAM superfamily enzyme YgiQ (UPF0313 family)
MPPLGLLYLGAALKDVCEVKVVDFNLDSAKLEGHDPGLIGIRCATADYLEVKELISAFRRLYPGVPVIVGGPHLSVRPGDYRDIGADVAVKGEGEEFIRFLAVGDSATLLDARERHQKEWGEGGVDVDKYPIPDRSLVPIHEYGSVQIDGRKPTSLISARGCPYSCSFCSHWPGYTNWRARDIDNVIEEIQQIQQMGFDAISFQDDEFNLKTDRLVTLCREIESLDIQFRINARADRFNHEQAMALALAGCVTIAFGVESGSNKILKITGKGVTKEMNSQARATCRAHGLRFHAYVQIGLPGETRETIAETTRWLIDNEVRDFGIYVFTPLPGSPIFEHPEKYDITLPPAETYKTVSANYFQKHTARTAALSAEEITDAVEEMKHTVHEALK